MTVYAPHGRTPLLVPHPEVRVPTDLSAIVHAPSLHEAVDAPVDLLAAPVPSRKQARFAEKNLLAAERRLVFDVNEPDLTPRAEVAEISRALDEATGTQTVHGNRLEFFIDGENAFPAYYEALSKAEKSILLETFIFHTNDATSTKVTDLLIAKKKAGLDVYVIADALGSRNMPPFVRNENLERLRANGVEVLDYNPPLKDLPRSLQRDHRKMTIIDGKSVWSGGMNMGDVYFGGPAVPKREHDMWVHSQGPSVSDFAQEFGKTWTLGGGKSMPLWLTSFRRAPPFMDGFPMRVITHAANDDEPITAMYRTLFRQAKSHIYIQNSFPMREDLVQEIIAARARGVEVRMVASGHGATGKMVMQRFPKLLDAGVVIAQMDAPSHMKVVSIDGKVFAYGSSNVDNFALRTNRENMIVLEHPELAQELERRVFRHDLLSTASGAGRILQSRKEMKGSEQLQNQVVSLIWPKPLH